MLLISIIPYNIGLLLLFVIKNTMLMLKVGKVEQGEFCFKNILLRCIKKILVVSFFSNSLWLPRNLKNFPK